MLSLLIVDDDPTARAFLQMHLRGRFEKTFQAETLAEAHQILERETVRVVLLDEQLPDGSGLEFFRTHQARLGGTAVIFVTGARDVDLAVSAMRAGARDFLSKPIDPKSLVRTVESVVASPRAVARSDFSRSIVGESPAMNEIWHKVHIFAPTDISVLILGESGTGKELFARALHAGSKRANGPFIELDCASLPPSLLEAELFGHEKGAFTDAREARKGRFELANGGTLFLDELGNLSLEVQAKLLRVLQERSFRRLGGTKLVEVDVRVIGATNLDLSAAIDKQNFRSDLYYRLAEVSLELPPLRQREGDVMRLAGHYLDENNRAFGRAVQGFTPAATALLEGYSWPGNVRELRNVMRSTTLLAGERADVEHLPAYLRAAAPRAPAAPLTPSAAPPVDPFAPDVCDVLAVKIPWGPRDQGLDIKQLHSDVRRMVDRHVLAVLLHGVGLNKTQLARYLKLDYKVLLEKLKDLGLSTPPGDAPTG